MLLLYTILYIILPKNPCPIDIFKYNLKTVLFDNFSLDLEVRNMEGIINFYLLFVLYT